MTEQLIQLANVCRVAPNVIRILGQNPGKFTLQGTNTYLISNASDESNTKNESAAVPCVLLDTGEGNVKEYTTLLQSILQGKNKDIDGRKRQITDIILTHWHHDHVGGLADVVTLLRQLQDRKPRLHKLHDLASNEKMQKWIENISLADVEVSNGQILSALCDGDVVALPGNDQRATILEVVHSPGHTSDHICLYMREQQILFTGDHILGQGTSVFEDLGKYLSSLRKCLNLVNQSESTLLLPGHGPTIEDGKQSIKTYLDHRLKREEQILQLLASKDTAMSIPSIVSKLYADYPEELHPAAARGTFLHLRKMSMADPEALDRGVVSPKNADGTVNDGRRIQCQVGGQSCNPPDSPKEGQDWEKIMKLEWILLRDGDQSRGVL